MLSIGSMEVLQLFQLLFEELLESYPHLRKVLNFGSSDHFVFAWDFVCDEVENMGIGRNVTNSRWLDFEEASKELIEKNVPIKMVLNSSTDGTYD